MKRHLSCALLFLVLAALLHVAARAADESVAPVSAEVTAVIQPYLDSYKLAGVVGIIADRDNRVHYRNALGYADVEAKRAVTFKGELGTRSRLRKMKH